MELAFTKLFNKIVTSSVWSEDDKTRIMWITMLALSDRNGYVAAALPGLADVSRMSLEDAKTAIKKLESPDPYSRSKICDGRRIVSTDGGWEIVTYDIHRKLLSAEERKQYKAEWIKKRRQQSRQVSTASRPNVDGVDISRSRVQKQSAEADKKNNPLPPSKGDVAAYFKELSLPNSEAEHFMDHYQSNGWKVGGKATMKDWQSAARNWKRRKSPNSQLDLTPQQRDSKINALNERKRDLLRQFGDMADGHDEFKRIQKQLSVL